MKFAFSTNAFRKYSIEDAADSISRAGFQGVELMCDIPHAWPDDLSIHGIKHLKALFSEKNLEISNLNAFMMCAVQDFHHPSWIEPDKEYRAIRVEYTRKCVDMAAGLGVKTISTEPGGPLNGLDRDIALEIFMEELDKVVPYAENHGIKILVEPEPGLLIETSKQFKDFADDFGSERIGLNFDVGHFFCVGEDPVEKIKELRDYIFHFHLEDIPENRLHQHICLGQGAIDIRGVLQTIESIGYKGFVTIELYPYLDSASEIACQSFRFLQEDCRYD